MLKVPVGPWVGTGTGVVRRAEATWAVVGPSGEVGGYVVDDILLDVAVRWTLGWCWR